jgi:DNA-binding NarL/FixJ family response regulator
MKKKLIKVIMVDDNVSFRTNLKTYIESDLGCKVVGEASNGIEFLELLGYVHADIILMDIAMEEMDGIQATKLGLWKNHQLKIIATTMHSERIYLIQLIEAGFKGCVFKPDIFNQLGTAINAVMDDKLYVPENISFDKADEN